MVLALESETQGFELWVCQLGAEQLEQVYLPL